MATPITSRIVQAIESVYSSARICGFTSSDINTQCNAALPKRTPQWAREYGNGYQRALVNELYRNYLVFGAWINGQFHSTDCQRDDYYQKQGIDALEWHKLATDKGHYWRHNLRPYFISEESD